MHSTPALSASSADAPLQGTTIERRELGAARRADRHQVLRHLPQRHPPGQGRVGRLDLPDGPRPRDRRRRRRGRRRVSASSRSATASASAAWSTPAASASTAWPARSSSASRARVPNLQRPRVRRRAHLRRLQPARSSSRTRFVVKHPRWPRASGRRAAAVRRHHDILAAEALARRRGDEGRDRRHGRPRPRRRADRGRDGRRGDRAEPDAQQAGGRAALRRQALLRDIRARARSRSSQSSFDLILNTVSANLDLDAYLRLLRVDGTLVTRRRALGARHRSTPSR